MSFLPDLSAAEIAGDIMPRVRAGACLQIEHNRSTTFFLLLQVLDFKWKKLNSHTWGEKGRVACLICYLLVVSWNSTGYGQGEGGKNLTHVCRTATTAQDYLQTERPYRINTVNQSSCLPEYSRAKYAEDFRAGFSRICLKIAPHFE